MPRDFTLQRKHIHTLPRVTTLDFKLRCFQYKILHNTLHLNRELLFLFHKHNTLLLNVSPFANIIQSLF